MQVVSHLWDVRLKVKMTHYDEGDGNDENDLSKLSLLDLTCTNLAVVQHVGIFVERMD